MQKSFRRYLPRRQSSRRLLPCLWLGAVALLAVFAPAAGCSRRQSSPETGDAGAPAVAGAGGDRPLGEGGARGPGGAAGAGGEMVKTAGGPLDSCAPAFSSDELRVLACDLSAPGNDPRIDDFEDGDLLATTAEGRRGSWYLYTDGTSGCATLDVAEESGNRLLRVQGQGFTAWGAGFGVSMSSSPAQAQNCTYDVRAYAGLRFRVQGDATLRVSLVTKAMTLQSLGGDCAEGPDCYDRPGRTVVLGEEWQEIEVDFCQAVQEGWGVSSGPFSPEDLIGLSFDVRSQGPFSVSIDDLEFIPRAGAADAPCKAVCPLDQLPVGIAYDPETTPQLGGANGLSVFTFGQETPHCGTLTRRYLSFVPSKLGPRTNAPVVLLLPGTSADAESMHGFMTHGRFAELAEQEGFIVVYANAAPGPYTVPERPNGGRFSLDEPDNPEVDDRAYLDLIISDLKSRGIISGDNKRFLAGLSIGGGLALEAALRSPQAYAGVAAIMPFASFPPQLPNPEVSYGLERVLIAYSHGDPGLPAGYDDALRPLAAEWAQALGLDHLEPETTLLDDRVIEGETYAGSLATALSTQDSRVSRSDYAAKDISAQIRVYTFDHAGHFWPLTAPYEDDAVLAEFGFRNQDMDMSDAIWEFFRTSL